MLHNIKKLYGNKLAALDGDIGHIRDFYFDEKKWVIRYLVADTGSWLTGRLVLLSPHAFGRLDEYEDTLHVKLSKKQIENCPSIESHTPVSRQYEIDYYRYYGWPAYWNGGAMWGPDSYPAVLPRSKFQMTAEVKPHHRDAKHLGSTLAIAGYHVQAAGEIIGEVSSLLVDDRYWALRELVVETGNWYSGKEIMLPTDKVERSSHEDSTLYMSLTKAELELTLGRSAASSIPAKRVAANFSH